nr:solanesyl diphosphate synthase 3, chloroplastic/mitochondrial [Ipomoea batatas]
MLLTRELSRISRGGFNRFRWLLSLSAEQQQHHRHHLFSPTNSSIFPAPLDASQQVLGRRAIYYWVSNAVKSIGQQVHHQSSAVAEEQLDPFSLVADELSLVANKLRAMVIAEVPKLASAAEYFFRMGVEGKRLRPTVVLLMATALNAPVPRSPSEVAVDFSSKEVRTRQQCIAEITEMIHVSIHFIPFHAFAEHLIEIYTV